MFDAIGKLLERVLYNRIETAAESKAWLAEEQAGFRKGRRKEEHIFVLNEIFRICCIGVLLS